MKKRILTSLLIVALLVTFTAPAYAAVNASYYLSSYRADLAADDNEGVHICYFVEGTDIMDELGMLSINMQELQTQPNGTTKWVSVASYTSTAYPVLMGSDTYFYGTDFVHQGEAGHTYRAYVTIYAGKDGGGDSRSFYTNTATARYVNNGSN